MSLKKRSGLYLACAITIGGVVSSLSVLGNQSFAQTQSLTGRWRDDLGSICYLRQEDRNLWWSCIDPEDRKWSNVFFGEIRRDEIDGDWGDLPNGQGSGSGTLTLEIMSSDHLKIVSQTGGYGSTELKR